MIYTGYTKTDSYYEFVGDEGKLIVPSKDVLLVDDESGLISIKNTASRCTVGLLKKSSTPPTPTFEGKWLATYADSSTTSAECDASSAITITEISTTDLVEIQIGDCVTSLGNYALAHCNSLPSITIPDNVTSIGYSAFETSKSITSITLGNGVTTIGQQAFIECEGLTEITLPSGVTSIGQAAFGDCTGLTSITINATTPPTLGNWAFNGTSNDLVIYVPAASVDTYKAASGWSTYASRIQAIP